MLWLEVSTNKTIIPLINSAKQDNKLSVKRGKGQRFFACVPLIVVVDLPKKSSIYIYKETNQNNKILR